MSATPPRPRLLVVHHTQSGRTGQLAAAVLRGAARCGDTTTLGLRAHEAGVDDLLACLSLLRAAYAGLPVPDALSDTLGLDLARPTALRLGGGHAVLDGKLLDSTNATDGIATLNAQPGEVVIVKVGTESYKVVVR